MILPSFATEVKNELARLTYEDSCCRTAELAALLRMGATITFGAHRTFGLNFTTENAAVARKVLHLLKSEGGTIRTEITVSRSRRLKKNNSYSVRVMPAPPVATLLEHLGFLHDETEIIDAAHDDRSAGVERAQGTGDRQVVGDQGGSGGVLAHGQGC